MTVAAYLLHGKYTEFSIFCILVVVIRLKAAFRYSIHLTNKHKKNRNKKITKCRSSSSIVIIAIVIVIKSSIKAGNSTKRIKHNEILFLSFCSMFVPFTFSFIFLLILYSIFFFIYLLLSKFIYIVFVTTICLA